MVRFILAVTMAVIVHLTVPLTKSHAVELVTGNEYFPYSDERIPGGGLATVLVKAVFERMGKSASVTFLSWNEGYEATRNGRYLATFPYIRTPERDQSFVFSDELFAVRPHIFMNYRNAPGLTQASDLAGKVLCTPKGWGVDHYLKDIAKSGRLRVYDQTSVVGCFKLLYDGKVDAISMDRRLGTAGARAISTEPWFKVRRITNDSSPNYLIVSRSLPGAEDWIAQFNEAKESLRKDGTIARLIQTYYENYP